MINGQRYLCSIPRIPPEEARTPENSTSPEEEEKELTRATARGWDLIKGMEENCLYFFSGWWSYSFCHGEGVRQFHQLPPGRNVPMYPPVEDKNVQAYILGRFDGDGQTVDNGAQKKTLDGEKMSKQSEGSGKEMREQGLARLETKGEVRYLVQKLKGGTTCDLTGKERRIEVQVCRIIHHLDAPNNVQYHCQPNMADRITLIKETATCQYLMVISTPRLCHDVAFLPPEKTKPHAIACTPVMPASSIPSYLAAQETKAAEVDAEIDAELIHVLNQLDSGSMPKKKAQFVGDIEIGAHALIPKGKKIEKSAVVGGGKETLIATIAKSDGFLADEKMMQKVGIRNGKEVDGVKREVERVAAGKGWRLDVVETPRGKELRGVIETHDEGKKAAKEMKGEAGEIGADDAERESARVEKAEAGDEDESQKGSEEVYKEEL